MLALPHLCAFALAWLGGERPEDEVILKGGRSLGGHVVFEDASRLILLEGSREREIPLEEVERFDSVVRALDLVLTRLSALSESDLLGLLDLARFCQAEGLPGEAEVFLWHVLAVDADNGEAHAGLGHEKRGKSWQVRAAGRSYRFEDLERLRQDWGEAWELSTTHFRVRTNLPLSDAARLTLDLERVYHDLYAILGPELELRDVIRPLRAWVHADERSFPESAGNRRSYFSVQDEALIVNASAGYEPRTLVHEALHQFLWATGAGQSAGKADVPAWVDEGLAEYFASGVTGAPGRLAVTPGVEAPHHFKTHASSKDPHDLSRVLSFGGEDFQASSDLALKYAQAYTLVYFLLHAEGERYRTAFLEFLRGCWQGQSSMTHFKRAIGVRERELEQAWNAYVRERP